MTRLRRPVLTAVSALALVPSGAVAVAHAQPQQNGAAIETSLQARVGDSGELSSGDASAGVGDVVAFVARLRNAGGDQVLEPRLSLDACDPGTEQLEGLGDDGRLEAGEAVTLRCSRTITAADRPAVLATARGDALSEQEETVADDAQLTVAVAPAASQQPLTQIGPAGGVQSAGPAPQVSGFPVVEPSRRPAGLARLFLRRGCRTGQLRIRVMGQGIRQVELFVDGRRRAVVRRANRRGEWRFLIRRLSVRGHRIAARVSYATGKPAETLGKSLFSCSS